MKTKYVRNDVYFCECCGKFYDCVTNDLVDVKYTEMPADMAINLMQYRQFLETLWRKPKRKRRRNECRPI